MSSPYKVRTSLACPRCSVVLPLNETVCYNCGYRLTSSPSSLSTTSAKTPISPQTGKQQIQDPSKRASQIYFIVVVLIIVIFCYAGIRAAGVSLTSFATPTHTTSSLFQESYPAMKGNPLFIDRFTDDTSGWNLQSMPGNYAVTVGSGVLSLESDKQKLVWEPLPGVRTYSNFQLMADARLTKGDPNNGYGFYIRGAAGQGNELAMYYRFELYGDGSYAIFKGSTDANGKSVDTKLVNFLLDSAIAKKGKTNHILIIARGSRMSFIVNNHLLQTVTDTSYTAGSIALFASNLPEAKPGAQAQFARLAVYPL